MCERAASLRTWWALLCLAAIFSPQIAPAQGNQTVYDDALENGWVNWSWCTAYFNSTDAAHSGSKSVKVTFTGGWQGFYLHHANFSGNPLSSLTFWINGGSANGHAITVSAVVNGAGQPGVNLNKYIQGGSVAANTWRQVSIPLSALKVDTSNAISGFWLQENTGHAQRAFYIDDIVFTGAAPPNPVHINVNAGHVVRTVDSRVFGINADVWDGGFAIPGTIALLKAIDNRALRFPGGSLSDGYHWKTNTNDGSTYQWNTNFDMFAHGAKSTGAQVFITANYGSGTPQEAAGWVTYSNVLKGYGFKYWEIGNEVFGAWEYDKHTPAHDPYTYATLVRDYIAAMKAADPTIKVGVVAVPGEDSWGSTGSVPVVNPRTKQAHRGWTPVMLARLRALGVTPDFLIYHRYAQDPGNESDSGLLQNASTWPNDAADLRQQLTDYLGAAGANVELDCTETNSVSYNPGKQTTSLVNGLFLADTIGNILQTEFNALLWWNLHNAQQTNDNNSSSLYGWRQYGDYGILDGNNQPYPTYYVDKLLTHFARGGDQVIGATSDYSLLSAYAVKRTDGTLSLLVINKSASVALNGSIGVAGYVPRANATVYSYGIPQDLAAYLQNGSLDLAQSTVSNAGPRFPMTFAPYSATVISLRPQGVPHHQTLSPVADSYVQGGSDANTNFGTSTTLIIKKNANSNDFYNRVTYLKFDLSSVTNAPLSASLNLTAFTGSLPDNTPLTLQLNSVADTSWTETGLTAANAPGLNLSDFTSSGTPVTTVTVRQPGDAITIDLTGFVSANLGKVVTLQVMVPSPSPLGLLLRSRNSFVVAARPVLSISY